jgi:hypothetical protein
MLTPTLLLTIALAGTGASEAPPEPYMNWGACPFECCQYGRWLATRDVTSFPSRTADARVAEVVRKGEWVTAETGVAVTTRLGRMSATRPIQLGQGRKRTTVPQGDVIYILHYKGEGYFAFWYNGETYSDSHYLEPAAHGPRPVEQSGVQLLQTPEWEWWVRIRTRTGRTRWVPGNSGFDGADACGGNS